MPGSRPREAAFMKMKNPKAFEALDYSHVPLDQQLSNGIHQMEIDVYADAKGGRFAHPAHYADGRRRQASCGS